MRIAAALLCHGQVHKHTSMCFTELVAHSHGIGLEIVTGVASASIVGNARNVAVDGAKAAGATHVLMVDADMIFPSCLLEEYVKHDADVIGTPYRRRGPPWGMMGEPEDGQDLPALGFAKRPVRFKWLATGLMMVKMSVFEEMEPPYFHHPILDGKVAGEDLTFCRAVKDLGHDILGLIHLPRVGHILEAVLWNDELAIMPVEMYDERKANGPGPQ